MPEGTEVWSRVGGQKTAFLKKSVESVLHAGQHRRPRYQEVLIDMYLDFVAVEHTAHRTGEGAAESMIAARSDRLDGRDAAARM
jgi:hypothetical protein